MKVKIIKDHWTYKKDEVIDVEEGRGIYLLKVHVAQEVKEEPELDEPDVEQDWNLEEPNEQVEYLAKGSVEGMEDVESGSEPMVINPSSGKPVTKKATTTKKRKK